MNRSRRPLPRFWYLPEGKRAAIILASDDHATKYGTRQAFAELEAESPPGCQIEAWECYRATSYLTPDTAITPDQVNRYEAAGFEVGIHADLGCKNLNNVSVALALFEQINTFGKQHLGIEKQETNRIHCISWNGWADTMRIERDHGIRLSMNYYYWPGSWIQGRPGFMTGSGFPMRIVDLDGKILDIYQAATHIVNENGIDHATGIRFMIDRALGPEQFFGMFGTHYDFTDDFLSTIIVNRQGTRDCHSYRRHKHCAGSMPGAIPVSIELPGTRRSFPLMSMSDPEPIDDSDAAHAVTRSPHGGGRM